MANKAISTVHPQDTDDSVDCLHRQTKSLARIHDALGPLGESGLFTADQNAHTGSWLAIMAH